MTTKREFEQRAHMYRALQSLGFTYDECEQLRRISMTLRRWHELECGDSDEWKSWSIERDEETGKPYMHVHRYLRVAGSTQCKVEHHRYALADRETGAKKRLGAILKARNDRAFSSVHGSMQGFSPEWAREQGLYSFVQTDPRGAALYILRPGDVPAGADASAYYSRGICVY